MTAPPNLARRLQSARKLLVIDSDGLGDHLHSLPALWLLRQNNPGAMLHVMGGYGLFGAITPWIDHVWPYARRGLRSNLRWIAALPTDPHDVAIVLTNSNHAAAIGGLCGTPLPTSAGGGSRGRTRGSSISRSTGTPYPAALADAERPRSRRFRAGVPHRHRLCTPPCGRDRDRGRRPLAAPQCQGHRRPPRPARGPTRSPVKRVARPLSGGLHVAQIAGTRSGSWFRQNHHLPNWFPDDPERHQAFIAPESGEDGLQGLDKLTLLDAVARTLASRASAHEA